MHISMMRSFDFWFGIVWCWRSISYFCFLASLSYMSISTGVVVAVALQKVDHAPYRKARAKCHYQCL